MSDLLRRRAMMQQSRGKTMQLLAEYTVTEPVRTISIPFTEQMRSCEVLYVMLDITEKDSDWLYIGFNSQYVSYYGVRTSEKDNFMIIHTNEATVEDIVFPAKTIAMTNTNGTPTTSATVNDIQFRTYTASKQIKAGTVKIYGEV
jgi:hypothetical protein